MTLTQERREWTATTGVPLGRAVRMSAEPGGTHGQVPSVFAWLANEDCLIAVGRPGERQAALDQALAYGIAEAGDRELILVLPHDSAEPTRRRLPWLDIPVRLYTFNGSEPPESVAPLAKMPMAVTI